MAYLVLSGCQVKQNKICSTPSIMCFQTFFSSISSKIVLYFRAIPFFNKNTNTHRLTQPCASCFCVIENGLTFSGWISIFLPSVPSPGWSRFLSCCHVKYIMTAGRRRPIVNRTYLLLSIYETPAERYFQDKISSQGWSIAGKMGRQVAKSWTNYVVCK